MTVLFATNHNVDVSKLICPACGTVGEVSYIRMIPEDPRDMELFKDDDKHPVGMCMCGACGSKWIGNSGKFSSSQITSFLYESFKDAIFIATDDTICDLGTAGEHEVLVQKRARRAVCSLLRYIEENKLGDYCNDSKALIEELGFDEDGFCGDVDDCTKYYIVQSLMDAVKCDDQLGDLVELYNFWIKTLRKYRLTGEIAAMNSPLIDFAVMPRIDEVSDMIIDN